MDNNNNNMMEYNVEESQKEQERRDKIYGIKKKFTGFFDKLKEDREDRKRAKEEEARVKAEEKRAKAGLDPLPPKKSSGSFSEKTITNQTIEKPAVKVKSKVLSPQEQRRQKQKRKKLIRNIMTIPEIILIILLALFLKNKYLDYSKDVHQILNYSSGNYVYEIHRDNQDIKVIKNYRKECAVAPCELEKLSEYDIHFGKNQMTALRVFMDVEFKFKSTTKSIVLSDLKTDYGKKSIYSMIHNSNYFLGFKSYNKYSLIDFEQMSTYTHKGYKYDASAGQKILNISMGEKPSSGYALVVNSIFKQEDDLYIYVQEQGPGDDEVVSSVITHPLIRLELTEAPKNIYVYNVESGEEYPNLDTSVVQSSMIQGRRAQMDTIGDLVGIIKDEELKG